jgi:hypothetical protein
VNAVLSSIDNIIECLENRNYYTSVICFLKHSKAFDSVSHTILISKQAFFYNSLITKVPHLLYDICIIEHNYFLLMIHYPRTAVLLQGVPQGCVGVPTLFIIFVNSDPAASKSDS